MTTSVGVALVCVLVAGVSAAVRPGALASVCFAITLAGFGVIAYLESR